MVKETFEWHEVSEKEREEIRVGAKKLMDEFAKSLEKVKGLEEDIEIAGKEFRDEEKFNPQDESFRKIILNNFRNSIPESARESGDSRHAPNKDKDCIIAERGKWVG